MEVGAGRVENGQKSVKELDNQMAAYKTQMFRSLVAPQSAPEHLFTLIQWGKCHQNDLLAHISTNTP
jgi:hypothetical protein